MEYMSPGAFNPNMDFSRNPLAGALAGMNIADMTQMLDRGYRDSDQAYLEKLHSFERAKAKEPMEDAINEQKRLAAEEDSDIIRSGVSKQAKVSKLNTEMDDDQTKQSNNRVKRLMDVGTFLNQTSEELKAQPVGSMMDGAQKARWDQIRAQGAKYGLNLPAAPDPQTISLIHAKAQSYIQNLPYIRESMAAKQKEDAQYRQATDVAHIHGQYGVQQSQINADSRQMVQSMKTQNEQKMNNMEQLLVTEIDRGVKSGKLASKEVYLGAASLQAEKELSKDQEYEMLTLQAARNPDAKAKAEAIKAAKIEEKVRGLPGADKVFAQSDLNRMAETAPKGAGAGGQTQSAELAKRAGQPGEKVQTEKGTYEWDAQRQGWKRVK